LWNSKDIRNTIKKKDEKKKEETPASPQPNSTGTPTFSKFPISLRLPLESTASLDIELADAPRRDGSQTPDRHEQNIANLNRGKSVRLNQAMIGPIVAVSPETPLQDQPLIERDETTGLPDLLSEWTDLLRTRLVKFNSDDTNKKRAEERSLLRFFFVIIFVSTFVILPVGLASPNVSPHSFLCDINTAKYVPLYSNATVNGTIVTTSTSVGVDLINISYPKLTVPFNVLVVIVLLIEVIMLRGVVDSFYLNHELRVILAILVVHSVVYIIIPFTRVAVFYIAWQTLYTFVLQGVIIYWPFVLCIMHFVGGGGDKIEGLVAIEDTIEFVLENTEARLLFKTHLAKSLCSEGVLFYESFLDFANAPADLKHDIATDIVDNFIRNGASNEVNLNGHIKKEIITRFDQSTFETCPDDLFTKAINNLKLNLNENGTFKAFKATNEFKEWKDKRVEKNVKRTIELAL
jgi:hypothetical protein